MVPSGIPWWGWLLCAVAFFVVGYLGFAFHHTERFGKFSPTFLGHVLICFAAGFWALSVLAFVIALIRFIKSVWTG